MRRIRAAATLSLLWAIPWAVLGVALGAFEYSRSGPTLAVWDVPPWEVSPLSVVMLFARNWALGGAISGGLFSVVLSLLERNTSIMGIRLARVALWGFVGSVLVPTAVIAFLSIKTRIDLRSAVLLLALVGAAGTISAVVTLTLARRSVGSIGSSAAA